MPRISRWALIAVVVGGVVGAAIGRGIYDMANAPNEGALLAVIPVLFLIAVVGALIIGGLGIVVFGDASTGLFAVLFGGSIGLGALVAGLYGDGIQIQNVSERAARIEVTLGDPFHETHSGSGTCFTVPNADTIRRIESDPFIAVGSTRLSISVHVRDEDESSFHSVTVVPDDPTEELAAYHTVITTQVEVGANANRTTGSARFTDLRADRRMPLGGPGGPSHLDGTVSWTCEE